MLWEDFLICLTATWDCDRKDVKVLCPAGNFFWYSRHHCPFLDLRWCVNPLNDLKSFLQLGLGHWMNSEYPNVDMMTKCFLLVLVVVKNEENVMNVWWEFSQTSETWIGYESISSKKWKLKRWRVVIKKWWLVKKLVTQRIFWCCEMVTVNIKWWFMYNNIVTSWDVLRWLLQTKKMVV